MAANSRSVIFISFLGTVICGGVRDFCTSTSSLFTNPFALDASASSPFPSLVAEARMRRIFILLLATVSLVEGQPLERVSSSDTVSLKPVRRAVSARSPQRHGRGHASIIRRQSQSQYGAIGLGDIADLTYTVALQIGGESTVLNLDTGSSDLWVITSSCSSSICQSSKATPYSPSSFQPIQDNADMKLVYGDSTTGTYASGVVGTDSVKLAGIGLDGQVFLAVNDTNNVSVENGAAGVLGLGFPTESAVQYQAISILGSESTDNLLNSIPTSGPLLPRLVSTGAIGEPMFTVTLQRDTIDSSATHGQLTIGTLPDNVDNSSLTWVPIRLYSTSDGGLQGPTFASNEIYPLRWEVPLDGVFLDGAKLPTSNISSPSSQVTALIDTGNSILRGPADVVQAIYSGISTSFNASAANVIAPYDCSVPHTLSFQFGGKQFPVDPRDFLSPTLVSNTSAECNAAGNLVKTDPPALGALYSWSLGDTFLKSNLVAFYYGNLTNPSVDPPRIGFMSLVPDTASEVAEQDVQTALANGGFFASSEPAPTSTIPLSSRPVLHPASQIPSPIDEPGASGKTSASATNSNGPLSALMACVLSILFSSFWIF
ncbi:acid protease [Schizopora paradoxa]|uniref:Acid protease n=1 Tax=Schizopora paradoxa TaxID=27342 RepID=A0A0H2S4X2_9AGAM|nr:acid protease [Schizopora paradoxa]